MYLGQRVIHTTSDISKEVNDWRQGSYTLAYTSGQFLYIGSDVPFNNIYFDMGSTVNQVSALASVQIWWANAWANAVDLIDETAVEGKSLAQSGRMTFRPSDLKGWDDIPRTSDVSDLSAFEIYDFYWCRFSWSQTLSADAVLNYVGQKFSDDGQLYVYYPDLNNKKLKTSYLANKTSWNDQHFAAAEVIIRDLISRNLLWSRGQILDASRFVEASIHKTAEIIYQAFGTAFNNNRDAASKAYKAAMDLGRFAIDKKGEAKLDRELKRSHTMFQTR